jgi:DNA-3-methyladenine glycosylase II
LQFGSPANLAAATSGTTPQSVKQQHLLSLPDAALRSAGLSGRKAANLRDLAGRVLDGTVMLDPARLRAQSDEEVIARLSSVRGVGTWTAQMFLVFAARY